MRKITFVNIFYSIFLILLTHAMEQPQNITVLAGDVPYEIPYNQALKSPLIMSLLEHQTDKSEIILPSAINPEIFDYIYKDMVETPYDTEHLKYDVLKHLVHTSEQLGIASLADYYTTLLAQHFPITLSVDGIEYILNAQEASLFGTLKNMIEDAGTSQEVIPLPASISSRVFDYIMKDIRHIPYDSSSIDNEMLIALINATNYLDNEDLLKQYLDHLAHNLAALDTYKKLEHNEALLNLLPAEMHVRLSVKIARIAFETLQAPQRVPERENIHYKKMWMSPNKQCIVFLEKTKEKIILKAVHTRTNAVLWQEDGAGVSSVTFSPDSTQILSRKNKKILVLRDAQSGKIIWEKNQKIDFKVLAFTPDNAPIIFLLKTLKGNKIVIIDARTGLRFGKTILKNFKSVTGCFYNAEVGAFIIEGKQESGAEVVFVIDMATSEKVKSRKKEHVAVSPNGKRIITLTNSSLTVENSSDEEHTFNWTYPRKFTQAPVIRSFAHDSNAVVLLDYQEKILMLLNLKTEKSIILEPANQIQIYPVLFSPHDQFLLYYTNSNTYTVFNVITKKEMWSNKFTEEIQNPYFLSESVVIFTKKPTSLNFYATRTGTLLTSVNLHHKIDLNRKFFVTDNNYLYCLLNLIEASDKLSIVCVDIKPVIIAVELLKNDNNIFKTLLLTFIINQIRMHSLIPLGSFLNELGYQELSEEIHEIVNHHNHEIRLLKK